MSRRLLLLLALAFMAPSAAFADDASYCTDLSNLYRLSTPEQKCIGWPE